MEKTPDQGVYTSDLGRAAVARLKRLEPVLHEARAVAAAYAAGGDEQALKDAVWSAAQQLRTALALADELLDDETGATVTPGASYSISIGGPGEETSITGPGVDVRFPPKV